MNVSFEAATPENPKVVHVSDRAFRLWFNATCYCRRNSTDGMVPSVILATLSHTANRKTVDELLSAGLFESVDAKTVLVHDYLDHNPSRADVEAEREASRERTRRWRDAQRDGVTHAVSNGVGDDVSNGVSNALGQSRTKREVRSREKDNASTTTLLVVDRFSEHVTRHDPEADVAPRSERWLREARLLIERDKRSVDQVLAVIDWLDSDSSDARFWRTVVLSMPKFREKFTQLVAKMNAGGGGAPASRAMTEKEARSARRLAAFHRVTGQEDAA